MEQHGLYQFGKVAAEKEDIEGINSFEVFGLVSDNTATKDGNHSKHKGQKMLECLLRITTLK